MSDSRTAKRLSVVAFVGLVLAGVFFVTRSPEARSSGSGTFQTENVVLVLIDGVRSLEAFKYPVGKGTHPIIPRLYHELRPQGALLTNMRNRDYTKTFSAMSNILTGRWNVLPNRGVDTDPIGFREIRSDYPTIIEHARRDLGLPERGVLFIPSKHNEKTIDVSFHPSYGEAYLPEKVFFDPRVIPYRDESNNFIDDTNTDDLAYQELLARTAFSPGKDPSDYPKLIVLPLGITDNSGHNGFYPLHLDVIRNADDIAAELWEYIQAHPHYADKTTLVIATDHGRHLPERGDFSNHTGGCLGCREVFTLFLGPDTTPQTVARRIQQIDMAPTIARFLGFDMPYSTGRPIHEVLGIDPSETENDSLTELDVVAEGDEIYVTYRRDVSNNVEIGYRRGVVDAVGVAFDPEQLITSAFPDTDLLPKQPTIGLNDNGIHVTWMQHRGHIGSAWEAHVATSVDGGSSFQSSREYFREILEDENGEGYRVPAYPHFVSGTTRDTIVLPFYANGAGDDLLMHRSDDFFTTRDAARLLQSSTIKSGYFRAVDSVAYDDGSIGIVYVRADILTGGVVPPVAAWDVFYQRVFTEEDIFTDPLGAAGSLSSTKKSLTARLTPGLAPSHHPSLVLDPTDNRHVIVVYADREPGSSAPQIFMRESFDRGARWTAPLQVTTSTEGAWEPTVVADDLGNLHIAYVDFDAGEGDIHVVTIDSGGSISTPSNISNTPEISTSPHIVLTDSFGRVVIWDEDQATVQTVKLD